MKLRFLLTLVFLLSVVFRSFAFQAGSFQVADSTGKISRTKPTNILWLNLGQLVRKELLVNYQKNIGSNSVLEYGFGYKFPTSFNKPYTVNKSTFDFEPYEYAERMPFSQGLMASIATKFYFKPQVNKPLDGGYISTGIFYRYRFYNHQLVYSQTPLSDYPDNYASQQSLDLQIGGYKILIGKTKDFGQFTKGTRLKFDIYTGLGYRWKYAVTAVDWIHSTDSGSTYTPPTKNSPAPSHPQYIVKEKTSIISFQAGLKVGLEF